MRVATRDTRPSATNFGGARISAVDIFSANAESGWVWLTITSAVHRARRGHHRRRRRGTVAAHEWRALPPDRASLFTDARVSLSSCSSGRLLGVRPSSWVGESSAGHTREQFSERIANAEAHERRFASGVGEVRGSKTGLVTRAEHFRPCGSHCQRAKSTGPNGAFEIGTMPG